jgi:Tectonin domain
MSSFVVNQDGRPAIFAIGNDKAIWYQTTDTTGTWGQWISLGGQWKQLAVAANQDGRFTVFAIGMDDAVWRCSQGQPNGSIDSGWASLQGQWKQLAVAANQDGRLTVFAIGMDHTVWHCWQTRPNGSIDSGWASLTGQSKQIGASRQPNGTLQVVGLGLDDESYRISQVKPGGPWGSWQKLFMGVLSGDALSLAGSVEFRLDSSLDGLQSPIMSLANQEPPQLSSVTRTKTTKELSGECALEFAKATLAFAKSYDSSRKGNIVETLAAIEVTAHLLTSAANKCAEAVQQGIDDISSDGSDSPDKGGVRGVEKGRYWDYVPGPSDGKIQVA